MIKRVTSSLLAVALVMSLFTNVTFAAVTEEEEIITKIEEIQSVYEPSKSYFVSNSTQKWVGEDNVAGDKTQGCFSPGTTNSHGRFGGLWQSMGFSNYVFYNIFGTMPQFGYHCNSGELNDNVEVIGRYASSCRYLRGNVDGVPTTENIKTLIAKSKIGDIIVVSPKEKCNSSGKAMVIVGVGEAHVDVYHADYTGYCAVTEDMITFDTLAQFHAVTLLRSKNYPYPIPTPPDVVSELKTSTDDISLNESVEINWEAPKRADKFKIYLVDETDQVVEEKETTSTFYSFVFKNSGKYKIKISASNEYGDSELVVTNPITVHNYNIVTFRDYDNTIITTQQVPYGKNATAPNVPQRTGHLFAGWDKSLENITEPLDITATYEVEKYTVKYYDVGGEKLIFAEDIEYQGKANPPTNYTIEDGYVFSGWQISFDSKGTDYNSVDGDMSLIATQKWANLNLPITIEINNPQRDSNATYYSADLVVENRDTENGKNFKIIGTLKSSNNKTLKSVVLDEVSLDKGERVTLSNRQIVYSEKASIIEFVAVGIVENSKTGGAYSKVTSSEIIDNSQWGSWTDWTSEDKIAEYDDYETKKQYRSRNKAYTTATSKVLNGWTQYNTTSTTGNWSGWSSTYVSAFTNESQKRDVETKTVPATYQTRWTYNRSVSNNGKMSTYSIGYYPNYQSIDLDYRLTYKGSSSGHSRYGSYAGAYGTYLQNFWWNEGSYQKQLTAAYNQYRYRDTFYTYHFWKWESWSEWSDTPISGDEVEERTVYRYRNNDSSGDDEDTSGNKYDISGEIQNIETDFSGLTATVMVYKKTNSDPTEEQLEYVGETIIGEDNTYEFSFIPREMPTSETGDFIIALGIEGADRLVNIDVIKAVLPTYTVKFVVDGQDYGTVQSIIQGDNATAPEPPEKEGFEFVRWSETLTNITSEKTVSAIFEPKEYSLVFVDWETDKIEIKTQKHGETIIYPELEKIEGVASRVWNKQEEGISIVSGSMVCETIPTYEIYTVSFTDDSGVISTQQVQYGKAATEPKSTVVVEGMTFAGWVGSCSPKYITHDVTFTPTYVYNRSVEAPVAEVKEVNEDGTYKVELKCDTENSEIYYVIESHNPDSLSLFDEEQLEDNFKTYATKYNGEITLNENETVTFVAYADGMNESIPVSEENVTESPYFAMSIDKNSLREYRNTIEGDVVVSFNNNTPEYTIGTFTLCFYDQRGILLDMIPLTIDIRPGMNEIDFGVLVDNVDYTKSKTTTCKLITWLSGEDIKPISDYVDIDIK